MARCYRVMGLIGIQGACNANVRNLVFETRLRFYIKRRKWRNINEKHFAISILINLYREHHMCCTYFQCLVSDFSTTCWKCVSSLLGEWDDSRKSAIMNCHSLAECQASSTSSNQPTSQKYVSRRREILFSTLAPYNTCRPDQLSKTGNAHWSAAAKDS